MNDKYASRVMDVASKLDALSNSEGEVTGLALRIVENSDDKAAKNILDKISVLGAQNDDKVKRMSIELKDAMISYYGYMKIKSIYNSTSIDYQEDKRTLEELLEDLNGLVGLNEVKRKVNDLIAYQHVQMLRKENGLVAQKNTLHLAFLGNPGTGKTTVARIVGRVYKRLGLLSKGHFIEASRTDLIAGYQGQTALKVKDVVERAKGGVLFIDEAYSLTENDHTDSYGRECLTELTKALEDYREDLVVIVAGYTELMESFFESNPGLKSRFNTFIEFGDYSEEELLSIMHDMCKKNDYVISTEAEEKIKVLVHNELEKNINNFANGRFIRNIYEEIIMNHARRINEYKNPRRIELMTIEGKDVE